VGAEGLEADGVSALAGSGLRKLHETPGHQDGPLPADLAEVVRAWDSLPVEVRGAILAIVRGAGG